MLGPLASNELGVVRNVRMRLCTHHVAPEVLRVFGVLIAAGRVAQACLKRRGVGSCILVRL